MVFTGFMLGCKKYEEIPARQRFISEHRVRVRWSRHSLFRHQEHSKKSELRSTHLLLWYSTTLTCNFLNESHVFVPSYLLLLHVSFVRYWFVPSFISWLARSFVPSLVFFFIWLFVLFGGELVSAQEAQLILYLYYSSTVSSQRRALYSTNEYQSSW